MNNLTASHKKADIWLAVFVHVLLVNLLGLSCVCICCWYSRLCVCYIRFCFSELKYMWKEHNCQHINVTIPGMRPFALCSGLLGLSRLDRLRGSWIMFFVWGIHSSWLQCNVEVPADPSKRQRHRMQQRKWDSGIVRIAGQCISGVVICYTHYYVWVEQTKCSRWGVLSGVTLILAGWPQWLRRQPTLKWWKRGKLWVRNMRKCEMLKWK